MSLFDKAKKLAQDQLEIQKNKVVDKIEQKKDNFETSLKIKNDFAELQKQRKRIFVSTRRLGDIDIDEQNRLIKIHNASAEIKNKMGLMGKATLAYFTVGLSLLAEMAMKPDDVIFAYDEIKDYDLYKNEKAVSKGKISDLIMGGMLLGLAHTAIISTNGTQETVIKNLYLEIDTSLMLFPIVMVPYISKETKYGSNAYNKAIASLKETLVCLDMITTKPKEPAKKVKKKSNKSDGYDELIKLKDLLDREIISQEEFDVKKKEILGIK